MKTFINKIQSVEMRPDKASVTKIKSLIFYVLNHTSLLYFTEKISNPPRQYDTEIDDIYT